MMFARNDYKLMNINDHSKCKKKLWKKKRKRNKEKDEKDLKNMKKLRHISQP